MVFTPHTAALFSPYLNGVFASAPIFQPKDYDPVYIDMRAPQLGTTILVAGGNSDHTSVEFLARHLAEMAWQKVRVVAIPGYDRHPTELLQGGGNHAWELANFWGSVVPNFVAGLVRDARKDGQPVFLGGFSLGGALAVEALHLLLVEGLSVGGLILGAPALSYTALEGPKGWLNGLTLAVNARRGKVRRPKKRPEGLPEDVAYLAERPWSSEQAAVLVSRRAAKDLPHLRGLMGQRQPPVLLIHAGDGDPTVSPRSARRVKDTFNDVEEHVLSGGHWVFAGPSAWRAARLVTKFVFPDHSDWPPLSER